MTHGTAAYLLKGAERQAYFQVLSTEVFGMYTADSHAFNCGDRAGRCAEKNGDQNAFLQKLP